ncbi:MAG TPA: MGMT family protein [Cyclobacteriaceae bacterium]|nr:MGMT family protein [Cyclobacteriaceae bacterium]HRJ82000.1 MGMT family protein [Cyclobacteriaceae bacterium]
MAGKKMTLKDKNFFDDVYAVVKLIPKGRVTSYGAIARYLGTRMSARMVGWAMHGAPKGVPAHRVVNSQGLLTGKIHFKTPTTMQHLLEKEGVEVINDKITHFSDIFWDPTKELL